MITAPEDLLAFRTELVKLAVSIKLIIVILISVISKFRKKTEFSFMFIDT